MFGPEILHPLLKATWSFVKAKSLALVPTFIVPVFVIACISGQFTAAASITGAEEPISIIRLPGGLEAAAATQPEALVLIMDPEAGQFAIPWKGGPMQRYWISLDKDLFKLNSSRLKLSPVGFEGMFPLYGVGQPVVVVVEGVGADELKFAGREEPVSIRDLRVYSEKSRSIALAGFVVSMFSLGLIVRPAEESWDESG